MLKPGQVLLHYRIVEQIGEGGMGVVFRAEDTKLGREVAIKTIPAAFAQEAERLARFEREARTLAALNHPNIAAIYGIEHTADQRFIVMELIPGESLDERLARGALPLDDTLAVCRGIAEALEAAHERGVVHRDLKPANVRVTPEGKVKVLDFGLAKPVATAGLTSTGLANSPTLTSAGTVSGTILGTAAYMSPEQARGRPVDRRTDLWAFGCVLYECLTGRKLFGRDTLPDSLAAILTSEPDLAGLAGTTPRRLVSLVRRCVAKDPDSRLRDAGDARLEIDEVLAGDRALGDEPAASGRTSWPWLALAGAIGLIAGALLWAQLGPGAIPAPTRSTSITAGGGRLVRAAVIAPSGRMVLMLLDDGVYVRDIGSFELRRIEGTQSVNRVQLSPDETQVAYFAQDDDIIGSGQLKRASLRSGASVTLLRSDRPLRLLAWDEDGLLALAPDSPVSRIVRIDAEGGSPVPVMDWDEGAGMFPRLHDVGQVREIPGRPEKLWTVESPDGELQIEIVDLAAGERTALVLGASDPAFASATGELLFIREGTLTAAGFDPAAGRITGDLRPLIPGVESFSLARDGTLLYMQETERVSERRLIRIAPDGTTTRLLDVGRGFHLRYSPDGRRVSVVGRWQLRVYDLASGAVRLFDHEGLRGADHVWTPDGTAIVQGRIDAETGAFFVVRQALSGQPEPEVLLEYGPDAGGWFPSDYLPDGSGLLLARYQGDDADLVLWDGRSEPRELLASEASEDLGRFSPDGRWLAYESNESGRQEVWIRRFSAGDRSLGPRLRLSSDGGRDPMWSPDSTAVHYEDFADRLWKIPIVTDPDDPHALALGERRLLLDMRSLGLRSSGDQSYAVAPSGDHIIALQGDPFGAPELRLVTNWLDTLRDRR